MVNLRRRPAEPGTGAATDRRGGHNPFVAHVVMVEAWYRGSHRAWADALVEQSRHDITLVTHAGVHWQWRLQGSAPTLARDVVEAVGDRPVDALVTTSSVPVAPLVGLLRRRLGRAAVVHYLHENQLTFPLPPAERDLTYPMIDWLSLLGADVVVANSAFHRDELFEALPGFLARFPDHPHAGLVDDVRARTVVVSPGVDIGVDSGGVDTTGAGAVPARLLWCHRWEHDKRPDRFVAMAAEVLRRRPEVRVDVVGSGVDAARVGDDLAPIAAAVDVVGTPERAAYLGVLRRASIALSTADHEFYGLAMAEAMAAATVPVAPARLAYPEVVPASLHDACLYDDTENAAGRIIELVDDPARRVEVARRAAESVRSLDVAVAEFDDVVDSAIAGATP